MNGFVAILGYLFIACSVDILAQKLQFPYTILLFSVGIGVIVVANIPGFHFLKTLTLNPDMLFYVFLLVLIFELGYNIK